MKATLLLLAVLFSSSPFLDADVITYTGSEQQCNITSTGTYQIVAYGAWGGHLISTPAGPERSLAGISP